MSSTSTRASTPFNLKCCLVLNEKEVRGIIHPIPEDSRSLETLKNTVSALSDVSGEVKAKLSQLDASPLSERQKRETLQEEFQGYMQKKLAELGLSSTLSVATECFGNAPALLLYHRTPELGIGIWDSAPPGSWDESNKCFPGQPGPVCWSAFEDPVSCRISLLHLGPNRVAGIANLTTGHHLIQNSLFRAGSSLQWRDPSSVPKTKPAARDAFMEGFGEWKSQCGSMGVRAKAHCPPGWAFARNLETAVNKEGSASKEGPATKLFYEWHALKDGTCNCRVSELRGVPDTHDTTDPVVSDGHTTFKPRLTLLSSFRLARNGSEPATCSQESLGLKDGWYLRPEDFEGADDALEVMEFDSSNNETDMESEVSEAE